MPHHHDDFWNEGATCRVEEQRRSLLLLALHTTPSQRRQGHARALIEEAQARARKAGKPLELFARAFADRPMSTPQLVSFYQSCGFTITREDHDTTWLIWHPAETSSEAPTHSAGAPMSDLMAA